SPAASTTLLSGASPRQSVYDPATGGVRPSSIFRPQSPTLDALPRATVGQVAPIPEGALPPSTPGGGGPALGMRARTASGGPVWPGLGPLLANPDMPSPALTEGSSTHAPDGLLDPRLGLFGQHGMQSQGAISFRDDMDYSRPIGGLVNNRQHSRTTIQTVSS
ncbi:hypothetical protein C8Q80DRAFT_1059897, partial [Daedaleopsis nitida]